MKRYLKYLVLSLLFLTSSINDSYSQILGNKLFIPQSTEWDLSLLSFRNEQAFLPNDRPFTVKWNDDGSQLLSGRQGAGWIVTHNSFFYDASNLTGGTIAVTLSEGTVGWFGLQLHSSESKLIGLNNSGLYRYSLSPSGDVTSTSYDGVSKVIANTWADMFWDDAGMNVYFSDVTIDQYSVTSPYDIVSLSFVANSGSLGAGIDANGCAISPSGSKLWVTDNSSDRLLQFELSTPGDITSFGSIEESIDISTHSSNAFSLDVTTDGSILTFCDFTNDNVIQYYIPSTTPPSAITDLALTTAYDTMLDLNWSVPSSTKPIKHYEIEVDAVFNSKWDSNSGFALGLTPSTSYDITVYAVDAFDNKSLVSNEVTTSTNTTQFPLFDDLISYYRFENDLLDSQDGNDGTGTNETYITGQSGDAVKLTNGYVDLSTTSLVGGKAAFSVSCWFRLDVNARQTIYGAWGTQDCIIIQYNSGNLDFFTFTSAQIGGNFTAWSDFTNWHHMVATYDGSDMKMYIDGSLLSTTFAQTGTMNNSSQNEHWGRFESFTSNEALDGGGVWDIALSQSEVTQIYNIQKQGFELK